MKKHAPQIAVFALAAALWLWPAFRLQLTFGDGSTDSGWFKPLVLFGAAYLLARFLPTLEPRDRT